MNTFFIKIFFCSNSYKTLLSDVTEREQGIVR